jgi:hypothetical protein
MTARQTFSQRIKARRRIWWGQPPQVVDRRLMHYSPHRWRDLYALRRRDDPEEAWRYCASGSAADQQVDIFAAGGLPKPNISIAGSGSV